MGVKPFSIRDTAKQIADLIRSRVPTKNAHVVGLSLGAQILVELLSSVPELVDHAIISSANLRPLPGAKLGMYSEAVMAASYWSAIAPLKWCDPWIRLNMKSSAGVPEQYFDSFRSDFRNQTLDSWTHVMLENTAYRMPEGLERASSPVLIVSGQAEYAVMRQSAQDLAAVLPHAQAVTVTHLDRWSLAEEHNWALKAPQLFAETVHAWVSDCPLPEAIQPLVP
jgi:pimeloyl-ACP methyl ester carboxylesterase